MMSQKPTLHPVNEYNEEREWLRKFALEIPMTTGEESWLFYWLIHKDFPTEEAELNLELQRK